MPSSKKLGLSSTQTSQHQARIDMCGLMTAKFIELANGNQEPLFESINELVKDSPDRMAGCMITILNLLVAYVSSNGQDMARLQQFNDYLLSQLEKDTSVVGKLSVIRG